MVSNYTQGNQGYAQWNPWGQQAQYQQAQPPWYMQQAGCGCQEQQPWSAPQPWGARQPGYSGQDVQQWQYAAEQWPDDFQDPFEAAQPIPKTAPGKKQSSRAVNLVLNILTFCFVGFVLAGSTVFAFSNNENKSLFGYRFYNVLTPSMQPSFKPGDMIFVRLADPSQVEVGDVVTFNPSAKSTAFLTHRVVELLPAEETKPARMVTKGDFNNAADPPVDLSAVIGVHVFTIPLMGKVVEMMQSNLIFVCVCFGAVFLLLMVLRAYFAVRKENKAEAARQSGPPGLQPDIHAFC